MADNLSYYKKNKNKFQEYYKMNKDKIHNYYLLRKDYIKQYNHNYYLKKKKEGYTVSKRKNKIHKNYSDLSLTLYFD